MREMWEDLAEALLAAGAAVGESPFTVHPRALDAAHLDGLMTYGSKVGRPIHGDIVDWYTHVAEVNVANVAVANVWPVPLSFGLETLSWRYVDGEFHRDSGVWFDFPLETLATMPPEINSDQFLELGAFSLTSGGEMYQVYLDEVEPWIVFGQSSGGPLPDGPHNWDGRGLPGPTIPMFVSCMILALKAQRLIYRKDREHPSFGIPLIGGQDEAAHPHSQYPWGLSRTEWVRSRPSSRT